MIGYTTKLSTSFAGRIVFDNERKRKALKIESEKWFQHNLNKFDIGDSVTVILTGKKPRRTEQQNRFYWVYLDLISRESGHSPEELHEFFKRKFLIKQKTMVYGQPIEIIGSTTKMSVSEFCDYILKIEELTGVETPPTDNYNLVSLRPKFL